MQLFYRFCNYFLVFTLRLYYKYLFIICNFYLSLQENHQRKLQEERAEKRRQAQEAMRAARKDGNTILDLYTLNYADPRCELSVADPPLAHAVSLLTLDPKLDPLPLYVHTV